MIFVAVRKELWDVNSYVVQAEDAVDAALYAKRKWNKDFEATEFKSLGTATIFTESTYPDH